MNAYQVRSIQDALDAIVEMVDAIRTDKDYFDNQVTILSVALEEIADGCDGPACSAATALKDAELDT